ncbi:MAG TPA: hypothetical protein ACQGQI_09360 [Xylella sp.]
MNRAIKTSMDVVAVFLACWVHLDIRNQMKAAGNLLQDHGATRLRPHRPGDVDPLFETDLELGPAYTMVSYLQLESIR